MNKSEIAEAETKLIHIAASIIRREYLPSLEKCRTIADARAEIARFDDRHISLSLKVKEVADELRERAIAESQAPQPVKKERMALMDSEGSVWIEPFSKWQRRALLHGIRTVSAMCECHAGERDPVIPHLSELVELSEQHKDYFEFDWDGKQWTGIMPNLNGG